MGRPFFCGAFMILSYSELLRQVGDSSRIAITGRPGVGKTTLGRRLAVDLSLPLHHTDDYISGYSWDEIPDILTKYFIDEPSFILEGVAAARCLKRGLWPDVCLYLERDMPTEPRHAGMAAVVDRALGRYPGQVIRFELRSE